MKINEKNLCVFARTPPFDMEGNKLNNLNINNKKKKKNEYETYLCYY